MDQETADYIAEHYYDLLKIAERAAVRHMISEFKVASSGNREFTTRALKHMGWLSDDQTVISLLAEGSSKFNMRVAERIMRETPEKVFLNRCAQCGQLARTPKAKQCRCGHQWHDQTA